MDLPVLAAFILTDLKLKVRLLGFLLPGMLMLGLPGIGAGLPVTGKSLAFGNELLLELASELPNTATDAKGQELMKKKPGHVQKLVIRTEYLDSYYFVTAVHHTTGDIYLFHTAEHDLYRLSPEGGLQRITTISEAGSETELTSNLEPLPKWLKMDITPNGSDIYLWYHGLGPLYRYSIVDDTIAPIFHRNIDRTLYAHSFNIDFKGNLYLAGGYGFWQFHNFILTANQESENWQNIASLNKNIVPNGILGNIYTNSHTIHYLIRDVDAPDDRRALGMYRLDRAEKVWTHVTDFRERLDLVEPPDDINFYDVSMSTTAYHNEDESVIYVPYVLEDELNLLEWNVETDDMLIYHLDSLGLSDKPALFRPGFTTSWIGVSLSSTDSLSTDITMVSFDLEDWPNVTVIPKRRADGFSPYLILLPVMFLLGAAYVWRQKQSRPRKHVSTKISSITPDDPPDAPDVSVSPGELDVHGSHVSTDERSNVHLSRNDDEIILKINEVRIPLKQPLEVRFWGLMIDSLELGISSIPFEKLDDTIMPYEHQKATKSRTRKKLLELASSYVGTDVFRVERSEKDRRKKVLVIDPSKFHLS